MPWRKYIPWISFCPICDGTETVYVYDKGTKRLWRFMFGNNRFACTACNITWRRKTPFHTLTLHSGKPSTRLT